VPPQHAELWKKALPKAKVEIFKGAGHLVLDEKPEAANAVAAFAAAARVAGRPQGGLATYHSRI